MAKCGVVLYLIWIFSIEINGDIRQHPNWPHHVEDICGDNNYDRIIGGKSAGLGQFPWMVQLLYNKSTGYKFDCSGTLITERYVVSAAHCKKDDSNIQIVVVGEYNMKTNPDCNADYCAEAVQYIYVSDVISHGFRRETFQNDIILIKLKQSAKFSDSVLPICLPTGTEAFGNYGEVAGWGRTVQHETSKKPSILQYVRLQILNVKECEAVFFTDIDKKKQICAGPIHSIEDSCNGDSGGPFMQVATSNHHGSPIPRYYLTGIVSYGSQECGNSPAIYTKVVHFLRFILDTIKA